MNKRQLTGILLILLFLPLSSNAQSWKLRRYEASVSLCTSQIYGDIGGSADANNLYGLKDIQILKTRPSVAFGARYKIDERMAVKVNLIFGMVSGNDEKSRNDDRNFSFTSTIIEPSAQFEYYLISERKSVSSGASFSRRGMINNFGKLYPYVFAGVGGIISNPKLLRNDVPVILDESISKFGLTFPLGIGIKTSLNSKVSLGFEFGRRFTTTDNIDGYTSEWSKANDLYDIGMFSLIYKIPTDRRGRPILGKATRFRR